MKKFLCALIPAMCSLPAFAQDPTSGVTITVAPFTTPVTAAQGGTGMASYTIGDLLVASGAATFTKLPDVAVGQVMASAGVGVAPAYTSTPTLKSLTMAGVTGGEIITNGSCATDTTGWVGANWSSSAGKCLHTAGASTSFAQAAATVVSGTMYKLVFTVSGMTVGSVSGIAGGGGGGATANGTYTFYFVAQPTTAFALFPSSSFDGSVSGISLTTLTGTLALAGPISVSQGSCTNSGAVFMLSLNTTCTSASLGTTLLHVIGIDGSSPNIVYDSYGSTGGTVFATRAAAGTAAVPTPTQSASIFSSWTGRGYGTTTFPAGSKVRIDFGASETWTDTANGTYVDVRTTPNTTATIATAARFQPSGGFTVGLTTDPGIGVIQANVGLVAPTVTGRYVSSGTTPSVANVGANSCGTTTATLAGNESSGVITVGATAGTQCRVTFATAAPTARDCTVTDSTTTLATRATVVDTTHTDFLGAFVAGDKVTYICMAR